MLNNSGLNFLVARAKKNATKVFLAQANSQIIYRWTF